MLNRNVILGLAYNSTPKMLFPFLKSLNATSFDGDLVLFTNNNSIIPEISDCKYKIIIVNYQKEWTWLFKIQRLIAFVFYKLELQKYWLNLFSSSIYNSLTKKQPLSTFLLSIVHGNYYMATSRLFFYQNYLNNHSYNKVFLTDLNDVIFQKNIFELLPDFSPKILAFQEDFNIKIQSSPANHLWITTAFGASVVNSLKNEEIYCSGTILGNYQYIMKFLHDFNKLMLFEKMPCLLHGFDQGLFNYMISFLKLSYFQKDVNGNIVFTVGSLQKEAYLLKDSVIAKAKSDNIPAVIHQYNRHDDLVRFVEKQYN